MSLEIVRRIRGNVHGTIDISAVEDEVIAHDYFQRLRRIKQLAFLHYVFPCASHTRFEHSLGVMELAGIAWEKLRVNQQRIADGAALKSNFAALEKNPSGKTKNLRHGILSPTFAVMRQIFESDYNLQVLRLAALLHDVGHPPFSHSGERFLPSWTAIVEANPDMPSYLVDYMRSAIAGVKAKGNDPEKVRVRHEIYSLILTEEILRQVYRDNPHLKLEVDPRDVIAVIQPAIAPAANSPLLGHGLHKMLHELISGELDIDRMDYLLRDSHECGVVYGIFDAGRILDGLCVYQDDVDKGLHVAIASSGLAAFEDYLRARQSMYLQVYFHKTAASCEAIMQHLVKRLEGWHLPANGKEYAQFDEYNIGGELQRVADQKLTDVYERKEFHEGIKDLLYRRRLWKMVFEVNVRGDSRMAEERFTYVKNLVEEAGYTCEAVSSRNALTRFRPRSPDTRSSSSLRLIKKDDLQFPRVVPIEDHLQLFDDDQNVVFVKRLYVAPQTDVKPKVTAQKVVAMIHEKIRSLS